MNVLIITKYKNPDEWFRLSGDYVKPFYDRVMEIVPKFSRNYIAREKVWHIKPWYFSKIFELAYQYYDRIDEWDGVNAPYDHGTLYIYNTKKRA